MTDSSKAFAQAPSPDLQRPTEALVRDFSQLVQHLLQDLGAADDGGPRLSAVLEEHLGQRPDTLAVVAEQVQPHRLVDADQALAALSALDPDARVVGIAGGDMRHHATLSDLLVRAGMGAGLGLGQVDYVTKATGPGESDHREVVAEGMWLFRYDGVPVAVRQKDVQPHFGPQQGGLEVLSPDRATASSLLEHVRRLMDELSVFRGQVVTFADDPYGQGLAGVTFVERPCVGDGDIVLPDGVLDRVRHHVLGIGEQRDRLRRHGQHLKRGVLLYGPPGTGKTHTMRYLLSASPGTTAVLLSGESLRFVQAAAKVARAHQPAIVVLEDCDLVAEDRSFGMGGPKPLLFEVLDALDGLDGDADVTFLLTTNRVEDLERALSQRPGRVDLAAEIPLPDEPARVALLRLYARGLFSDQVAADVARRCEGTTASFAKELVRRAVLRAALDGADPADQHLTGALDDLLSDGEALTRSLLGVEGGERSAYGTPYRPRPSLQPDGPGVGFYT